jgi:hypothetical protein
MERDQRCAERSHAQDFCSFHNFSIKNGVSAGNKVTRSVVVRRCRATVGTRRRSLGEPCSAQSGARSSATAKKRHRCQRRAMRPGCDLSSGPRRQRRQSTERRQQIMSFTSPKAETPSMNGFGSLTRHDWKQGFAEKPLCYRRPRQARASYRWLGGVYLRHDPSSKDKETDRPQPIVASSIPVCLVFAEIDFAGHAMKEPPISPRASAFRGSVFEQFTEISARVLHPRRFPAMPCRSFSLEWALRLSQNRSKRLWNSVEIYRP